MNTRKAIQSVISELRATAQLHAKSGSEVEDPEQAKLKKLADDLEEALNPLDNDNWIYRIVAVSLGLIVLAALICSFALDFKTPGTKIPDVFLALGSGAVAALAGLFKKP